MGLPWISHGQKARINIIIWCAVGAAIGWLAGMVTSGGTKTSRIEDIAVGIFGSFIGGQFLASVLNPPPPPAAVVGFVKATAPVAGPAFSMLALALAVAGAVVMLIVLAMMRRAVGPMGQQKRKGERN